VERVAEAIATLPPHFVPAAIWPAIVFSRLHQGSGAPTGEGDPPFALFKAVSRPKIVQ